MKCSKQTENFNINSKEIKKLGGVKPPLFLLKIHMSIKKKFKGLSDKAVGWLFIGPTVLLLLAINIYPLVYAIKMSFTNFYANKIGREPQFVGLKNYIKVLNKEAIWEKMQVTASFMFWTLLLQAIIGLGLALLLNRKFKGNELLTTLIVLPMMLSPAVVGVFWTYLYNPQVGLFLSLIHI